MSRPTLISLLIHTASPDHFLREQGLRSYFEAVLLNLWHQSFCEKELVFVDAFYEENRAHHASLAAQAAFPVKHVPVHPAHRYWYDKGYVYIAAAKNTGILYADGELLITCDDAEFFPHRFLHRHWELYQQGCRACSLHKRWRALTTAEGLPVFPLQGDEYVDDKRWRFVSGGAYRHQHAMTYAGSSFTLQDALRLNGYNEKMDSCKSLDDTEFGVREELINTRFALDPECYLYILDHPSYAGPGINLNWPDEVESPEGASATRPGKASPRPIENLIAIENYGWCCCARELFDVAANRAAVSLQQMTIIQRETLKYRQFDPLGPENAGKLQLWKGTPNFDLTAERAALRASPEWRW